jgi:aminotransferase
MFKTSLRTKFLKQSSIRTATNNCIQSGGINLGQGITDLPIPEIIKEEAYKVIKENKNIYSACEGILPLRQAISNKLLEFNHINSNPEEDIIITHGSTGAFVCACKAIFDKNDEVILFEPFYSYHKNILNLLEVNIKTVSINLEDFSIDYQQLETVLTAKTKAIVICTPNNPSGKVYSREELIIIGEFAERNNLYLISDEIYEYFTYPGCTHISIASLENFQERTITISGFSKTYNMTGWRLGYATGPKKVIEKMALIQDLLYVCPNTPLQYACLAAFENIENNYFLQMQETYLSKRNKTVNALRDIGFKVNTPQGSYYLMADFRELGIINDQIATDYLLKNANVAVVPGSAFYQKPEDGEFFIRICYSLNETQVLQAMAKIQNSLLINKLNMA